MKEKVIKKFDDLFDDDTKKCSKNQKRRLFISGIRNQKVVNILQKLTKNWSIF